MSDLQRCRRTDCDDTRAWSSRTRLARSMTCPGSTRTRRRAGGWCRTWRRSVARLRRQGTSVPLVLSIQRNGLPGYWGHGPGGNGIYVRHSADGGRTWDKESVAVIAWTGNEPDVKLEDMPRIWADTQAKSPYRGNLYIAWIEWQIDKSIVLFSRSTDAGKTWTAPYRISTKAGLPRDDNGAVVGIIGTVAPDGIQYVVWNEGLNVTMAVSRDGGKSFESSRPMFDVGAPYSGGASGIPGVPRALGFPQAGI